MKDDKIILVTVKAKKLTDCTLTELQADTPILRDENGIEYKQLIDEPFDKSEDVTKRNKE